MASFLSDIQRKLRQGEQLAACSSIWPPPPPWKSHKKGIQYWLQGGVILSTVIGGEHMVDHTHSVIGKLAQPYAGLLQKTAQQVRLQFPKQWSSTRQHKVFEFHFTLTLIKTTISSKKEYWHTYITEGRNPCPWADGSDSSLGEMKRLNMLNKGMTRSYSYMTVRASFHEKLNAIYHLPLSSYWSSSSVSIFFFLATSYPFHSQMGGSPLRGDCIINIPKATPTPCFLSLVHPFLPLRCAISRTDPVEHFLVFLLMKRPFSHQ